MIQYFCFRQLLILCLLLLLPVPALAVLTVNLNYAGNNSFLLSGKDLQDVARIEATVSYDVSSLANPRLIPNTYFPGATVTMNQDTGGTVRLIAASGQPMKGQGPFAMLTFDPLGTSVGNITSFYGRVYGANGASQPVNFSYTNPTPPLDPSDPDDWPMIKERESKGQSYLGGEVTYVPPEATGATESGAQPEKSAENKDSASSSGETNAQQPAQSKDHRVAEKAEDSVPTQPQSVLERFRLFRGKQTAKALTALFDTPRPVSFTQDPKILIADGKETLKVRISGLTAGKVPRFTFHSARYVSLRKLSDTEWLVQATPDKGVVKACIDVLDDGKVREIPLTVSPSARVDLVKPGTVSEADLTLFLKKRGTTKSPLFDLNRDRKRDYVDDYIFTANYLVAQEKHAGKKPAVQQAAEGKGGAEGARLKKTEGTRVLE